MKRLIKKKKPFKNSWPLITNVVRSWKRITCALRKPAISWMQSLAEDQASLLEVTRLISDLEKQIEVAKLQSSQAAHSRRENLERLDAVLARLEEAKKELAQKQEKLAVLQQRLAENRQQQEELEKELANYEEDPEQVIEHLREQYVALLQMEAEKSNERTAIESRIQALLQESSHRQEDLTKAQSNFEAAKEKEVRQLEELDQAQATVKGLLSRIPRAIGKSGAGQKLPTKRLKLPCLT